MEEFHNKTTENILSTHFNTLSKLNCILASIEANKLKYDEGIMNDPHGNISTCNSTNLFFKKSQVWTSKENFVLMELLEVKQFRYVYMNNIACNQKDFNFEDIKDCEEAFCYRNICWYYSCF